MIDLGPDAGVIAVQLTDVEFEHSVRMVQKRLTSLLQRTEDEDQRSQFCRALREAKLRLMDVGLERGFDVDDGAKTLLSCGRKAHKALKCSKNTAVTPSIARHVRQLQRMLEA